MGEHRRVAHFIWISLFVGLLSACSQKKSAQPQFGIEVLEAVSIGAGWPINPVGSAGAEFGATVAGLGDMNGDGFADIAIGAPSVGSGRVYFKAGQLGGIDSSAAGGFTINGPIASSEFGRAIKGVGDVNGDGFGDVLVGAPNANGAAGAIYLVIGQDTADPTAIGHLCAGVTCSIDNNSPGVAGDRFGQAFAPAGDVNGDGFADVVISAPGYLTDRGRVYLYTGSATGLNLSVSTYTGAADNVQLGNPIASIGDLNGDSINDVVLYNRVGGQPGISILFSNGTNFDTPNFLAPNYSDAVSSAANPVIAGLGDVNGDGLGDLIEGLPAGSPRGRARFIQGTNNAGVGGISGSTTFQAGLPISSEGGAGVGGLGDIDGDGYPDFAIGLPAEGNGEVWVYNGTGGTPGTTADTILAPSTVGSSRFGQAIAGVGDTNGDGFHDFLVGAPEYTGGGAAWLYLGGPDPSGNERFDQSEATLGEKVAVGDFNGDGYDDAIATTAQSVRLWYGAAGGLSTTAVLLNIPPGQGASLGSCLASGDINGDGFDDILLGSTEGEGRVYYFAGRAAQLDNIPPDQTLAVSGLAGTANFAAACATVDLDGDGFQEIAVGAPDEEVDSNVGHGRVYLFQASENGPEVTHFTETASNAGWVGLGHSLANGGDRDGDGLEDLIIGAPGTSAGNGSVFVWFGESAGSLGAPQEFAGAGGASLGSAVTGAGDVNGDGYGDFAATSPGENDVLIYLGSDTRTSPGIVSVSTSGTVTATSQIASGFDRNADGLSDVLLGEDGLLAHSPTMTVLSPSSIMLMGFAEEPLSPSSPQTDLGRAIAMGDFNADGYGDVVAGYDGGVQAYYGNDLIDLPRERALAQTDETDVPYGRGTRIEATRTIQFTGRVDQLNNVGGDYRMELHLLPPGEPNQPAWTRSSTVGTDQIQQTSVCDFPNALSNITACPPNYICVCSDPTAPGETATITFDDLPGSGINPGDAFHWRARVVFGDSRGYGQWQYFGDNQGKPDFRIIEEIDAPPDAPPEPDAAPDAPPEPDAPLPPVKEISTLYGCTGASGSLVLGVLGLLGLFARRRARQ